MKKISLLLVFVMLLATLFAVSVFAKDITSSDVESASISGGGGVNNNTSAIANAMFNGNTNAGTVYEWTGDAWYGSGADNHYISITFKETVNMTAFSCYVISANGNLKFEAFDSNGQSVFSKDASNNSGDATYGEIEALTVDSGDSYNVKSIKITVKNAGNNGRYKISEISVHGCEYTTFVSTTATCTDAGESVYSCSCGNTETRAQEATGHDYSAAGPDENGATTYTCSKCSDVYVINNSAINGTYTVSAPELSILVFADGKLTIDGTEFNYTYNVTTGMVDLAETPAIFFQVLDGKIFLKGAEELQKHSECDWFFMGYDENNAPTCDFEGIAYYVCLVCGAEKQETVLHRLTFLEGYVEGQEPTCTEYGYAVFSCLWCNETETRKVAPTHSYEVTESENATCTEGGYRVFTCTLCGDSYKETLEPNGHNQKWQYDSTTATCTQAGVEIYGCWNCDEKIEVPVDAYGHDWYIDDSTLDLVNHTVDRVCSACEAKEAVSSLGMEADPIEIEVPGSFTASVAGWKYYKFTHTEGYITFTFDTENVNVMIKDTTYTYATQYFWGGNTTWNGELMADGSYVIAICSNDGSAIDIAVETEFEEADIPNFGEVAEKPIVMEGVNYAYTSTGKVWYTIETPTAGTVTITVEGTATVSYGTDPEALTVYTAPFVDENGWTTYYILVDSTEEATIVVNVEAPVGTLDNPLQIEVDKNNTVDYQGGWQPFYASYFSYENGTLTITYDSENAVVMCGTHPYMMSPIASGDTIDVTAWGTIYFGITTADETPATINLSASFEREEVVPEGPDEEIGEVIGSMEVEVTETYSLVTDLYTYIAENAGKYTFYVPANLGFFSLDAYDAFANPEVEIQGDAANVSGAYVTVELEAGEEYSFYVGAITKGTWTIDVYYLAPAVDEPTYEDADLVIGEDGNEYTENTKVTYTAGEDITLEIYYEVEGENTSVIFTVNGDIATLVDSQLSLVAGDVLVITVTTDEYVYIEASVVETEAPHECVYDQLVSIKYANGLLADGTKTYACECGETSEVVAPAIFAFLGYSVKEDESAMCVSYTVDREALEAYENANGVVLKFGLVNAGYDNLVNADGKPVNADGTTADVTKGCVATLAVEGKTQETFEMKMVAKDWSVIADVNIILCAYVIEGDSVSYICGDAATDSAVAVTYNSILGGNA